MVNNHFLYIKNIIINYNIMTTTPGENQGRLGNQMFQLAAAIGIAN
jgi:hypothetical protein